MTTIKSYIGGYALSDQTKGVFYPLIFTFLVAMFWEKAKKYCVIFFIAQLVFLYNIFYYKILDSYIEIQAVLIMQTIGVILFLISFGKIGYFIFTSNLEFLLKKKEIDI